MHYVEKLGGDGKVVCRCEDERVVPLNVLRAVVRDWEAHDGLVM